MIFWEVIIPVFLIILVGYGIQNKCGLDIRSLTLPALHIMIPALVFTTFYEATLDGTYAYILIYGLLLMVSLVFIVRVFTNLLGLTPAEESAFQLSTVFMNNGNFGVPIILFAFGDEVLSYGLAIMVLHLCYMSTFGIYFAARGKYSLWNSFLGVLKMPVVHATVLAFVLKLPGMPAVPGNFYESIELLANAAIPLVLLVLGMQLAEITVTNMEWNKVASAVVIRLVISTLIAVVIVFLLPVSELLGKVMIVQAAMPTAVVTTLYAVEFDCHPDFVSTVAFFTTLISALTLTVLLYFI